MLASESGLRFFGNLVNIKKDELGVDRFSDYDGNATKKDNRRPVSLALTHEHHWKQLHAAISEVKAGLGKCSQCDWKEIHLSVLETNGTTTVDVPNCIFSD